MHFADKLCNKGKGLQYCMLSNIFESNSINEDERQLVC